MAVSAVSPTAQKPLHHVTLGDGTTTVGLIAVKSWTDKNGEIITAPDENKIDIAPSQPLAIQTSQGNSEYSDREWPYMTLEQKDWSGGRGGETFEDDRSRYFEGHRVNTWREGEMLLGPLEYYGTNYRTEESDTPGLRDTSAFRFDVIVLDDDPHEYWSTMVTPSADINVDEIWVYGMNPSGSGSVEIHLYSDDGSDKPNASLGGAILTYVHGPPYGEFGWWKLNVGSAISLTAATKYHVVVTNTTGFTLLSFSRTGDTPYSSPDGTTWTLSTSTFPFRLLETADNLGSVKFFEHKGAHYCYSKPPSGNSFIYLNGDRGTADSNAGDKTNLEDASKAWTTNEWAGCKVKIIAGPGSEEEQPWREVSSNDSNSLVCDHDWNTAHTTATDYVITKSDKWTVGQDLGGFVTDHVVTDNYVYFARGETASKKLFRYQWYNNAGAEGARNNEENIDGKYLLSIHHPENQDASLYIAQNDHDQHGVAVGKMKVPGTWNDLVFPMGQLAYTNTPWADRNITNCTQTTDEQATKIAVAAGFTTGLCAVHNLEKPVNITKANQLGLWIKSNAAVADTQLYLQYDDFKDSGGDSNYLIKKATANALTECNAGAHTTMWEAFDGEPSTESTFTLTTATDALYVVGDFKYSTISMDIGTTPNAVIGVLSADYFNGKEFTSLSITDGTDGTDMCTIANGTFTTVTGDWGTGTGWDVDTTSADKAHCNGTQVASTNLYQACLTVGKTYKISYTVSGRTGGNVTMWMGGTTGTTQNTNDTFTETLACTDNTNLIIQGDADFVGDIDDVILQSIPLSVDGDITFTPPADWQQYQIYDAQDNANQAFSWTGYIVRLTSSATHTADTEIAECNLARSNQNIINLGALTADEWTYKVVSITPEKFPAPDDTQVQSVGLYIEDDFGAAEIMMKGGIDLLYDEPDWKPLPSNDLITNLVAHNGNVQEPRTNPWVFTDGAEIYEMQTQNEDQFIPVTIGEMGTLRSENTGKAACVNDVYLYFSLGEEKLERWFNNSLEDVGPDRGAGLAWQRRGPITALLSMPGEIYMGVGGPGIDSTYNSWQGIYMLRGSSIHEVYSHSLSSNSSARHQIKDIHHIKIPGDVVDQLWFSQGSDIIRLPVVSSDPRHDSNLLPADMNYHFCPHGTLETGWMYAGMKDIVKIWDELKVFGENLSSSYFVEADYKTDGDTSWTAISGTFDTDPSEAIAIATTRPNKKRLKLRLKLFTKDLEQTPEVKASLLNCFGVTEIKYVYTFPIVVADEYDERDLQGEPQKAMGYTASASTAITKLRSWASAGTPLTLNSNVAAMDNSTVVIQGPPLRPVRINNKDQKERYLLNVTARDV